MNATTPLENLRNLLLKPVPEQALQTRDGPGGRKYHYVDGDFATAMLNELFKFDNVSIQVLESKPVLERRYTQKKNGNPVRNPTSGHYEATRSVETPYIEVVYAATVRIEVDVDGKKVIRDGSGTCSANGPCHDNTAVAKIYEMAIKGAETDALKRAAKKFGPRLGLSLDINGKQIYATMSEDALLEDSYRDGNAEDGLTPASNSQPSHAAPKQAPRSAQELEREARTLAGQPATRSTSPQPPSPSAAEQPARTSQPQQNEHGQARPTEGPAQPTRPSPAPQPPQGTPPQNRPAATAAPARPQTQGQPQQQRPTGPVPAQARANGHAATPGTGPARPTGDVEPTEEQLKQLDTVGWTAQFKALNSKLQATSTRDQIVAVIEKLKLYRPLMQVGEEFAKQCENRMIELIQAHAKKLNVDVHGDLFPADQANHEPYVPF